MDPIKQLKTVADKSLPNYLFPPISTTSLMGTMSAFSFEPHRKYSMPLIVPDEMSD
jgi:hypothetical protein